MLMFIYLMPQKMKAIILAWGKGERLLPITEKIPKPLIKVGWVSLVQRIINQLPEDIPEVLLVIKHLWWEIIDALSDNQWDKRITYVTQNEHMLWTLWALHACKPYIGGDIDLLVISADNIYSDNDIAKLSNISNSILMYQNKIAHILDTPLNAHKNSVLIDWMKDFDPDSKYINTWAYNFSVNILDEPPELVPWSHEYSIPHTLLNFFKKQKHEFIYTDYWLSVWTYQELDYANKIFDEQ